MMKYKTIAETLDKAALEAQAIEQISKKNPLNLNDAYKIQFASMRRRFDRGERMTGVKLGFTSRAKMEQMGVHDMIFGILTDAMEIADGAFLEFGKFIHPRVEPEVCFMTKKKIDRPISMMESPSYIESVGMALEVIDSRYKDFKFTLEDVVADNCSSSAYVLGQPHSLKTDISNLGMVMSFDDEPVRIGSSAAILGNPLRSIEAASRLAYQYEQVIPAGSIILAGAATSAEFLKQGISVSAMVEKLGGVRFRVK
jgi:2-oxo-3-hexenedioate decarboxylase